ncbi:MAG: YgiT-type zinc finger protein [Acidimicrobiales bacterium]
MDRCGSRSGARCDVSRTGHNRDHTTLVVKAVPADVCDNCGEEYLDEHVTSLLLHLVDTAARTGVEVEVREFATPSPVRP